MKEYKVRLRYQSSYGVRAEDEKEAATRAKIMVADNILSGVINLEVFDPQELILCEGCEELVTQQEIRVHEGKKRCVSCLF